VPAEYIHGPLFDIVLKGIESGYYQYFRSIPTNLSQHYTLDILSGQSINEIFNDLKSGKTDYKLEYKYYRVVKSNKSEARDTAFKLLYLILYSKFKDKIKNSAKVFNVVLFAISYLGTLNRERGA
jgi:hypothetical protein